MALPLALSAVPTVLLVGRADAAVAAGAPGMPPGNCWPTATPLSSGCSRIRRDARTASSSHLAAPTENAPGLWASLITLAVTILTIATYGALLATVTTTLDQLDRGVQVTAGLTVREVVSNRRPLARAAVQYWVVFTVLDSASPPARSPGSSCCSPPTWPRR